MKKNIKKTQAKNVGYYQRTGVETPEVTNMEELSYYDDDSLERQYSHLQTEREKASREGYDLRPWEVEICYVQRELKIRTARRAAHERYIRSNPDAYYDPSAQEDFDQTAN